MVGGAVGNVVALRWCCRGGAVAAVLTKSVTKVLPCKYVIRIFSSGYEFIIARNVLNS
jgi:hypothetical protein